MITVTIASTGCPGYHGDMDNYVAVVFDTDGQASDALHELWNLDNSGAITVHGAAVIQRDRQGRMQVATKRTDAGVRTVAGIALGALIGSIFGPAGAAVGIAAAAGGVLGLSADAVKSDEREQAAREARLSIADGQFAVLAEVSEDSPAPIDVAMQPLGGVVYRRAKNAVNNDALGDSYYADLLLPYDYQPHFTRGT
jgi:uncharacterized membrane protein